MCSGRIRQALKVNPPRQAPDITAKGTAQHHMTRAARIHMGSMDRITTDKDMVPAMLRPTIHRTTATLRPTMVLLDTMVRGTQKPMDLTDLLLPAHMDTTHPIPILARRMDTGVRNISTTESLWAPVRGSGGDGGQASWASSTISLISASGAASEERGSTPSRGADSSTDFLAADFVGAQSAVDSVAACPLFEVAAVSVAQLRRSAATRRQYGEAEPSAAALRLSEVALLRLAAVDSGAARSAVADSAAAVGMVAAVSTVVGTVADTEADAAKFQFQEKTARQALCRGRVPCFKFPIQPAS